MNTVDQTWALRLLIGEDTRLLESLQASEGTIPHDNQAHSFLVATAHGLPADTPPEASYMFAMVKVSTTAISARLD